MPALSCQHHSRIHTATTGEVIPLDFAMLMSRSPPTGFLPLPVDYISQSLANGAHHGNIHQLGVGVDDNDNYDDDSPDLEPDDYLCNAPFPCRRVSTFPLVASNHFHFPKASSLKSRSVSESNCLNNHRLSAMNMNDLKLELSHIACVIQHQPTQLVHSRVLFPSAPEKKGSSLSSDEDESDDDTPPDSPPVDCIDEPMESFTIRPNLLDCGQDMVDLGLLKVAGQYSPPMKYPSEAVDRIKNDVSPRILSPTRYRPSHRPCRKRVCFADERGRDLATVRIMKEASDVPPKLDRAIIRALIGDDEDSEVVPATWQMNFKQPCSEYIKFRDRLAAQNVALENLVVKNDTHRLVGTIKVRNMCFHKEVFVRLTENQWHSYIDNPAQFSGTVPGDPYDTFAFDFEVPADDDLHPRLEFAICFKAIGSDDPSIIFEPQEFWDNNDSLNYILLSGKVKQMWDNINRASEKKQENQNVDSPTLGQHSRVRKNSTDAFTLDYGNWSNFASWRDLTVEGPYW